MNEIRTSQELAQHRVELKRKIRAYGIELPTDTCTEALERIVELIDEKGKS